MGGSYEFVKTASANLREKEDHWNVAMGGLVSGALLGLRGAYLPDGLVYNFVSLSLRTSILISIRCYSTDIPCPVGLRLWTGHRHDRIRIRWWSLGTWPEGRGGR